MPKNPIPNIEELDKLYQGGTAIQVGAAAAPDVPSPSERREIETVAGMKSDRWLRVGMAIALTVLFLLLNGAVVGMLYNQVQNDRAFLAAKLIQSGERLVNDRVYMSLIGGTVLQVAAIVVTIARYLFPARNN